MEIMPRTQTILGLFFALLVLSIAAHAAGAADTGKPKAISVKSLTPLTGEELLSLVRKEKNKATVVNVWATFCPPCLEEMPELLTFKKDYEGRGVKLILISADGPEDEADAVRFLKRLKVDFPSYRMGESSEKFVAKVEPAWGSELPATFLYDSEGKLLRFWTARIKMSALESNVSAVLGGKTLPDNDKTASDGKSKKGTK